MARRTANGRSNIMCCSNQAAHKALQGAVCACLEQLETRRLMSISSYLPPSSTTTTTSSSSSSSSCNVYDTNSDGCKETLRICGTEKCDTVTVWVDKDGDRCIDDCEVQSFKDVQKIEVTLKGGDDKLKYVLVSDLCHDKRSLKADLGCGNDCFEFESGCAPRKDSPEASTLIESSEHGSADITDCSELCLDVNGSDGNDKLDFDFSKTSIKDSKVTVYGKGGKGDDCIGYQLPTLYGVEADVAARTSSVGSGGLELISNSCVNANFSLGDGCNTLNLKTFSLISDSTVNTCFTGGCNTDKVYDSEAFILLGCTKYTVKGDLGSGNDSYCGEYDAGSAIDRGASACFDVKGGYGYDTLKFKGLGDRPAMEPLAAALATSSEGSESLGGIAGLLSVNLDGGCNNDCVRIDLDCPALHVTGKLKLIGSGGDGCDDVAVTARVDSCSRGCYEVKVLGGNGDDKVALGFQDDSVCKGDARTTSTVSSYGTFVLDGGCGCDKWDTEGNVCVTKKYVERLCEELLPPFCDVLINAA
jgi:hypothetical protein